MTDTPLTTQEQQAILKLAGWTFHPAWSHGFTRRPASWRSETEGRVEASVEAGNIGRMVTDLTWLFANVVPEVDMDTLRVHLGCKYAFGYARGDMVCWSPGLPVKECLSPVQNNPGLAVCRAVLLELGQKGGSAPDVN